MGKENIMTSYLQPASGRMETPAATSALFQFIWSWLITPVVAVYSAFKLLLALVLAALLLAPLATSAATVSADSGHAFIHGKLPPLFR